MSEYNNIALRIVRDTDNYYFQARLDTPDPSDQSPRLLSNIETPQTADPPNAALDRFRTLFIHNRQGTPLGIGLFVKTMFKATMCDAVFLNMEVKDGSAESVLGTNLIPPLWDYSSGGYNSAISMLPSNSFMFDRPAEGTFIHTDGEKIHIVAPFMISSTTASEWPAENHVEMIPVEDPFDHNPSVDRAPKLIAKSPTGNFAIATSARINRSAFTPWAGGYATGKTMWGTVRTVPIQSVILNEKVLRKQSDPAISNTDPSFTYKTAFIVLARDRATFLLPANVQKIRNLDILRRYWDKTFEILTLNRRHSDSSL